MIKKIVMFLLLAVLSLGCGNKKHKENKPVQEPELVSASEEDASVQIEVVYVGIVELDEQCGVVIRVKNDHDEISFAPSNFDERYKKVGMRVRFGTYDDVSKVQKCDEHYIISLSRITPLRD